MPGEQKQNRGSSTWKNCRLTRQEVSVFLCYLWFTRTPYLCPLEFWTTMSPPHIQPASQPANIMKRLEDTALNPKTQQCKKIQEGSRQRASFFWREKKTRKWYLGLCVGHGRRDRRRKRQRWSWAWSHKDHKTDKHASPFCFRFLPLLPLLRLCLWAKPLHWATPCSTNKAKTLHETLVPSACFKATIKHNFRPYR